MRFRHGLFVFVFALSLSGCGSKDVPTEQSSVGKGKMEKSAEPLTISVGETLGTPMVQRVAILGLLNKRNGETRDIELKPGEALRFGKVVVRLRACEKTAPWENYPDQGAFVQLIVMERPPGTNEAERWRQVFSGWLFKENPAANVVQHRVYDVWVKECRMSFPGEEDMVPKKGPDEGAKPEAKKPSSAPQSEPTAPQAAPAEDTET